MTTANLFQSMWYVCPNCGKENTVSVLRIHENFKCVGCKSTWTGDGLFTLYHHGSPVPPKDKLAPAAVWYCECGRKNVILPRTERLVEDVTENGDRRCTEYVEVPKYGLCEDCFAEYDLTIDEEE